MELDPKCAACISWGNNKNCQGQKSSFVSISCPLCEKYLSEAVYEIDLADKEEGK